MTFTPDVHEMKDGTCQLLQQQVLVKPEVCSYLAKNKRNLHSTECSALSINALKQPQNCGQKQPDLGLDAAFAIS